MRICFNGCSFTVGIGFPKDQRDQYIYDRLLQQKINVDRVNIAVGGSSNYKIFMRSADAIMSGDFDCVVTQWSALNRLWLYPGPDTEFFLNDGNGPDYCYRDIYISSADKSKLKTLFLLLNGDYQNIVDLIDFCNILVNLGKVNNTKTVFINGIVPWTDDLIRPLSGDLEKSLSEYSKSILDFKNRSDDEIIKFFQQLQLHFNKLDQSQWVNLFESWIGNVVDRGPDGHHPGILSHQWMADKLFKHLTERKII